MDSLPNLDAIRAHFASLPALTYLSSGSYGLLSNEVRSAFNTYLDNRVAVGADWGGWVETLEGLRGDMATLLSVAPDEVAITGSASTALNALAGAIDFSGPRNKVLVSNFEFPTSGQIWHAQAPAGAVIEHVPETSDGILAVESFVDRIDEQTAVVALSQVCYRHGGRIPDDDIRAIARLAHAKGAIVILDVYQIIGTEPISPAALGVDVCVGGMLKYLLGTAGVGFLYIRHGLIEQYLPRATGWFAQAQPMLMDIFANDPSTTARRFEAGTPPVPNCIAARAGVGLILDIGLDAIARQIRGVTRYTLERLKHEGIAFSNPDEDHRRGPLISVPTNDENALVAALAERNVITSSRDGRLRAGFHVYNDQADADRFVAALIEHRHMLRSEP